MVQIKLSGPATFRCTFADTRVDRGSNMLSCGTLVGVPSRFAGRVGRDEVFVRSMHGPRVFS